MTFCFGTNTELLYCMPALGTNNTTASSAVCMTANSSSNPPFQQPTIAQMWTMSQVVGKGLMYIADGTFDSGGAYNVTTVLSYDTTQGTSANTIASTGAYAWASTTAVGAWHMQVMLNCVSAGTSNATKWYVTGFLTQGVANNATTTAGAIILLGGASSSGTPSAVTLTANQIYYPEIWMTASSSMTAFYCTTFMAFGLN